MATKNPELYLSLSAELESQVKNWGNQRGVTFRRAVRDILHQIRENGGLPERLTSRASRAGQEFSRGVVVRRHVGVEPDLKQWVKDSAKSSGATATSFVVAALMLVVSDGGEDDWDGPKAQ